MNKDIYLPQPVPKELQPYVKRLLVADCAEAIDMVSPAGATGSSFFGWHYRGKWTGVVDGKHRFASNGSLLHIAGQIKGHQVEMRYQGRSGHALIQFSALGLYQLLGITGEQVLAQQAYPADCNPELHGMCNGLLTAARYFPANTPGLNYLHLMVQALTDRLPRARMVADFLVNCVVQMEASNGMMRVSDIAREVGISPRQLNREFTRIVGLQPKSFCQVLQVNRALQAMLDDDKTYLTEIAQHAQFSDQAHFTRVFRQFLSSSPREFLNSDETLLFHFLGNKRTATQ